jgi:RNA polymerase sigma-70 factor (ECF subfamily)
MTSAAAEEYRGALIRFVVARGHDPAAAEDIVHDVLLRAWERRGQLRDDTKLAAWLYQMTRHAIVDHHRAQRPSVELPEEVVAPETERLVLSELAQCLEPLIARLPDPYRAALQLAELDGLTQQETATRLGISLSGAKSRVQRARAKLHEMVMQCCEIERDHRGSVIDYEPRKECRTCAVPQRT